MSTPESLANSSSFPGERHQSQLPRTARRNGLGVASSAFSNWIHQLEKQEVSDRRGGSEPPAGSGSQVLSGGVRS